MLDGGSIDRSARVLVVEDEPLVSDIVSEVLAEQGFAVRVVDNAGDALACLSSDSPVDVLFTDLNLNGTMDGDALAQRARELRPDLPVVYTSGRLSAFDRLQRVAGSLFVPKPYDPFNVGSLLLRLVTER
jgi:CheY-like chemotaxis protein